MYFLHATPARVYKTSQISTIVDNRAVAGHIVVYKTSQISTIVDNVLFLLYRHWVYKTSQISTIVDIDTLPLAKMSL